MTDQALGVEHGVECLEAPEWPPVPRSLIRELDGRSVYTRPGVTRYATRGQLSHGAAHVPAGATPRRTRADARVLRRATRRRRRHPGCATGRMGARRNRS